MAGEFEALENEVFGVPLRPKEKTLINTKDIKKEPGLIRGDLAKAMAPKLDTPLEAKNALAFENIERDALGKSHMAPVVLARTQQEVKDVLANKNPHTSAFDALEKETLGGQFVTVGVDRASLGDDSFIGGIRQAFNKGFEGVFETGKSALDKVGTGASALTPDVIEDPIKRGAKYASGKIGEAFQSELAQDVFTTLSIDEHLIVKGLSKVMGDPDKEHMGDYTWTNFLIDRGAPNDPFTNAIGIGLSIGASPSTYLTLGAAAEAKLAGLGSKYAGKYLTKEGRNLVNQIIKTQVETKVMKLAEKGVELSSDAVNKMAQKTKRHVEMQVLKRFGAIDEFNKGTRIGKAVRALPESVVSKGGAKLSVPFVGKEIPLVNFDLFHAADISVLGKTVVPGQKVAEIANRVGLPKFAETMKQSMLGRGAGAVQDTLGTMFIKNYGVDRALVNAIKDAGPDAERLLASDRVTTRLSPSQINLARITANWEDTVEQSNLLKRESILRAESFFQGLKPKERKEFAEKAIQASTLEEKVLVTSQNANVQERLDKWYGQGKYEGQLSVADELAEKSKLLEHDVGKLANWFPGVDRGIDPASIRLQQTLKPSDRKFLQERQADPKTYTRDPVQAFATRLIQIGHADLQDEFYRSIVKSKIGDPKTFESELEALKQGYAKLSRPLSVKVFSGKEDELIDVIERGLASKQYYPKEFVRQFESLTKKEGLGPIASLGNVFTSAWRRNVTSYFPSFHARNFNSNIVLNAMRIGGHAFDPSTHMLALDAVRGRNLKKSFVTDIGEKLTIESLLEEADQHGALKKGFYQMDIGGENLSPSAQFSWAYMLNKANPFSPEFIPVKYGSKIGEGIESQGRLVNYISWRKKGLSPKAATHEVNEALFDYDSLTDFERNKAKLLFGFYTFSRKNIENHAKILMSRPGVITAQMKFFRDIGPNEDEMREQFPDWAKKNFAFKFQKGIVTGMGLPFEDIMQLVSMDEREAILRTNPVLRIPAERYLLKKDFYSGRPIEKLNNANEFAKIVELTEGKYSEYVPSFIKDAAWEVRSFLKLKRDPTKPNKIIGDPNKLHMSRALFTSRFQSMMGQLEKDEVPGAEKAVRALLGLVKIEPDPKLKRSIEKWKTIADIKKIAEENNLTKPLDTHFYGGDKFATSIANWYLKEIQYGGSVERMRRLKKQFEAEAVRYNEKRTSK